MNTTWEINGRFWKKGERFVHGTVAGELISVGELLTIWLVTVKASDGQLIIVPIPKGVMEWRASCVESLYEKGEKTNETID
jgi:hypothetical protein